MGPKNALSLGNLSGRDIGGSHSNSDFGKRRFETIDECREKRAELIELYKAEDPGNWGSLMRVNRWLVKRFRYILDNQAKAQCQEILLEAVVVNVEGEALRAAKSLPIRTVEMELCIP